MRELAIETKLEVISKSIELMKYTYTITSNKKRYPVKYKILVSRIQNECMNIYSYLMDANRLQLSTSKNERLEMQTKAITSCDKLSCYAELSMNLNLVGTNTISNWQKMICDVKYMTIAWRSKDKNR